MKRQGVRQSLDPCVVYVDHFSESDSDYEGEQVAGTEGALQKHQCEDEQGLEYIVPCTEAECRKSGAEDQRYGGNGRNPESAFRHQIDAKRIDQQHDQESYFAREVQFFRVHKMVSFFLEL